MDKGKKILVSASTLVDLKAELFRKQEQLKQSKLKSEAFRKTSKLNLKVKETDVRFNNQGKNIAGIESRINSSNDKCCSLPEDDMRNALEASRKKLEEKANLYDKLSSGNVIAEEDDVYMVDFQRKILYTEKPDRTVAPDEQPETIEDEVDDPEAYLSKEDSEDWVEYTDSLGRSRRCLKKDLPSMIEMDNDLKRSSQAKQFQPVVDLDDDKAEDEDEFIGPMPSANEIPSVPLGPLHYQNVQDNEIRNHGVGYFAFSQSEQERQKQMDLLNSLRNQTEEQRERREKLKTKRQQAMRARLEKVKQRKKLNMGEVLSDNEKSDDDFANFDASVERKLVAEEKSGTVVPAAPEEQKPAKIRPWDKGKIGVSRMVQPFRKAQPAKSQKDWIEERRGERLAEFAPPNNYYHNKDVVEEMHDFFKKTWRESVIQKEAADASASCSPKPSEPSFFVISDIPLPPS